MPQTRQIHIIAGPNGAGKSSLARIVLLPQFLKTNEFVNADEIAKNLSPENPAQSSVDAGRLMLKRMEFLLGSGMDFAFETTLSARIYLNFIKRAKACGYKVNLIFLKLESVELALERVINRVSKGGHNIESLVVRRRFQSGLKNLQDYLSIVDAAVIYEASGSSLVEIAKKNEGQMTILNQNLWEKFYA